MPDRTSVLIPNPPVRASTPPRADRFVVAAAWPMIVVLIGSLLFLARLEDPRRIVSSGDSMWYMRQALVFAGASPEKAEAEASRQLCRDANRALRDQGRPPTCVGYRTAGVSPRYVAIFDSRPGYPLFAAPFVAVLGAWHGMLVATMVLALAAALLAYLAVWMATGLRLAGLFAAVLLFVLPTGYWMTRMLTESGVLAGSLALIVGAMAAWSGRLKIGLPMVVVALVWLFAFRSASGMVMALTVLAASVVALFTRSAQRRAVLLTGGLGLVAVLGWQIVSARLNLPGLNETIQDFATAHFQRPDVPHPIRWLTERNVSFWPDRIVAESSSPEAVVALLFAVVVLVRGVRPFAPLWIFTGLTGVAMLVAHPVASEYDRLMLPMWLPVAGALGYAAALATCRRPGEAAVGRAGSAVGRP